MKMKKRAKSRNFITLRNFLFALLLAAAAVTVYGVAQAAVVTHQGSEIIGKVAQATQADNSNLLQGVSVADIITAIGWRTNGANSVTTGSGNVGIGTSSPSAKLDVNGTIKGTQFCIGNSCTSSWSSGPVSTGLHGWIDISRGYGAAGGIDRVCNGALPPGACNCDAQGVRCDPSCSSGYTLVTTGIGAMSGYSGTWDFYPRYFACYKN